MDYVVQPSEQQYLRNCVRIFGVISKADNIILLSLFCAYVVMIAC